MITKYITAAQADAMRARAIYMTPAPAVLDRLRGIVGVLEVEYYVVPDDDPRLQSLGLADHIADSVRDYLNATLPPGVA